MAIKDIYNAVLEYNKDKTVELVNKELDSGSDISEILNQGLISALDEVGQKFSNGEIFVPEMIISAKIVESALDVLRPQFIEKGIKPKGRIVIGTVKGDLHDIGKNLVAMMLEGGGFEVCDMGTDVSPEAFVQAVKEKQPDFVVMSALLTTTMPMMKETIASIQENGLRGKVKIMVGGAPVTQDFADKIKADGFSIDAPGAVKKAISLIGA